MDQRCRVCGSERIAPNVRLGGADAGGLARVRARVCADCGYVELHAENALDLYLAHLRSIDAVGAAPGTVRNDTAAEAATANIQCPSCGGMLPAAATSCDVCGWSQASA